MSATASSTCAYRCEGKRIRLPLESADLTAAVQSRADKEEALNVASVLERKGMIQTAIDKCLVGIQPGRKKKTYQAYSVALRYLIEAVGNKELSMITRDDLLAFRVYLREGKKEPRSEYNKFESVMTFLKRQGRLLPLDRENSLTNLPRRHAIR